MKTASPLLERWLMFGLAVATVVYLVGLVLVVRIVLKGTP